MTQIEAMRNILLAAGYSRHAVETVLADARRLRDEIAMLTLSGMVAKNGGHVQEALIKVDVDVAFKYADAFMERRTKL
jgi:hypothetical protein